MLLKVLGEEQARKRSEQMRDEIISLVSSDDINDLSWHDPADVEEAKTLAQDLVVAFKMLTDNRDDMQLEHKMECFDRLKEVKRSHDAWWKEEKKHRREETEEKTLNITLFV